MDEADFPPPGLIGKMVSAVDGALSAEGSGAVGGWMVIVEVGEGFDLTIRAEIDDLDDHSDHVISALQQAILSEPSVSIVSLGKPLKKTEYIEVRLQLDEDGDPVLRISFPNDWQPGPLSGQCAGAGHV